MRMKKVLSLLLAGAITLSFTACGGGNTTGTKSSAKSGSSTQASSKSNASTASDTGAASNTSTASSDVTLNVAIWDTNQEPGLKDIMADFTAKTGIKTNISVTSWNEYWTMLEAGAQGGSLPDVFWMHSNESQRYMSNDMLLDLTDKIKASDVIQPENYPADIWSLYTYDSKYYAVPKDIDTIALWYNKKLFDEAKMDYPTADWTWEDMFAAAKKLTKPDGSVYGIATRNDQNQSGYYNIIYSNDGFVISDDKKTSGWDNPKTIEAMKLLEGAIKDGSMPSLETMTENREDVLFVAGKVAMAIQGSWMIAAFRDNEYTAANCDVVELPKNKATGRRVSIYNGLGWAASANGSHTEEAWKLIEYLGSKEAQEKQAKLGVTMSAYKDTSDAWASSAKFNLQAYLNMTKDMVLLPFTKNTITWENSSSEILQAVYKGEKSMEDACKEMAAKMNEILAEE